MDYSVASGAMKPHLVLGGLSQYDDVANNEVKLINGNVGWNVFGGYSLDGNVKYNAVTISDGNVGGAVFGGYSTNAGAEHNAVTIDGGEVTIYVYGAIGRDNVAYNTVTINDGRINNYVVGGSSSNGNTEYNEVTMNDGYVAYAVYGAESSSADSINNKATINGGQVKWSVIGGKALKNGNAAYNEVTISGGDVGTYVSGGYCASGNAAYNKVTISGGDVGAYVFGGYSASGEAKYNTATISGGKISEDVFGGYSVSSDAAYNEVTISGGTISGDVFGGYSVSSDAVYNIVTIEGNPTLTTSNIYGGYTGDTGVVTGNTLNFKSSNISAVGVGNFEYYNFYLPDGTAANEVMLSVTDAVDLTGTTVQIYLQGNTSLQEGDRVALINSSGGVSTSPNNSSGTASLGAFITYDFDLYTDVSNLWAQLTAINSLQQSNVILTDSRLASLAFLNQGTDLICSLEYLEVSGDSRFNTFAVMGGGSSTYGTGAGAEVDVDGFSLLAGVMWQAPINKNSLILSAFLEAGWGSYDTCRNFGSDGVIKGGGDTNYYGGGLHMRYKWNKDTPDGLYAEASLRVGRNKSDFYTNDLTSVSNFSYDSSSSYYGAHAGLGYIWQLSGKTRLEATSKYLWTRLGSDEVTSSAGDRISFDSLSSNRWRTGFRLYHDYGNDNAVTLYYGAAYEYEFSGDADGRLCGLSLDGISLSGGSGIGEFGVIFRPSKNNDRLIMQLGIQGYMGVREGVSGTLKLQYAF